MVGCFKPDSKRAKLGNYGLGRALHCAKHKREGEVDVVSRRCCRGGCLKTALFGQPGGSVMLCSEHKGGDNVDLKVTLDAKP